MYTHPLICMYHLNVYSLLQVIDLDETFQKDMGTAIGLSLHQQIEEEQKYFPGTPISALNQRREEILVQEEINSITDTEWLSGRMMNAASTILRRQFPDTGALFK